MQPAYQVQGCSIYSTNNSQSCLALLVRLPPLCPPHFLGCDNPPAGGRGHRASFSMLPRPVQHGEYMIKAFDLGNETVALRGSRHCYGINYTHLIRTKQNVPESIEFWDVSLNSLPPKPARE